MRGVTVTVARNAGSDQHWTIDGRNHIESTDLPRLLGQLVAPTGPMLRGNQGAMRELLKHFGYECGRDAILLDNLPGATSVLLPIHRQRLYRNQTVVGCL